jgi:hypothetical protein
MVHRCAKAAQKPHKRANQYYFPLPRSQNITSNAIQNRIKTVFITKNINQTLMTARQ